MLHELGVQLFCYKIIMLVRYQNAISAVWRIKSINTRITIMRHGFELQTHAKHIQDKWEVKENFDMCINQILQNLV
jgi:head-tail adaptor